jgi:hypothetical protein
MPHRSVALFLGPAVLLSDEGRPKVTTLTAQWVLTIYAGATLSMLVAFCLVPCRLRPNDHPWSKGVPGLLILLLPYSLPWSILGGETIRSPELLTFLALMGTASIVFGMLNGMAWLRGDFRWYVEAVVSALILLELWAIILPVFATARMTAIRGGELPTVKLTRAR